MSSLSTLNKAKLEEVFNMENGYVGRYSNLSFRNLIIKAVNIDVYGEEYKEYPSKAKKLRHFIDIEPDDVVGKLLITMLDERDVWSRRRYEDDDDPYISYVNDLREAAVKMSSGQQYTTNEERLNADIATSNMVLSDLINVSEYVCNNNTYCQDTDENPINDYYRDMLKAKGYAQVFDQTRHGISGSGKKAGSVDLLLAKKNKEVAIIEAFRLSCINQTIIKEHIDKAIVNYNALGTPTFLLIYAGSPNYGDLWTRFFNHLKEYDFSLEVKKSLIESVHPNASTRICSCILSRDSYDFPVTFLAVNVYKKIK